MGTGNVINDPGSPLLGPSTPQFKPVGLFWNIVKSFAGAGTFALPWAVMNAGMWGGVGGILLIALLSTYTVNTLMKCNLRVTAMRERESKSDMPVAPPSYPEIGYAAFGRIGSSVVSLFSALMCFGVCLAYFLLIANNIQALFPAHYNVQPVVIIACVFPFVLFLSCLTDLTKLSYTSIIGTIALLVAMCSVCVYGLKKDLLSPVSTYPVFEWKTFPLFLGGAAFLFCGHVILVPLANSSGSVKKFPMVLILAVVFVTITNVVFATLCYGFWKNETGQSVIDNLDTNSPVGDIVRIGISGEIFASFPLVANAGFQALETGFPLLERVKAFPFWSPAERKPFFSRNIWYYVFRGCVLFVLAAGGSFLGKNFGSIVSLVGSLTTASTGFVFPQLFYLKLFGSELKMWDKCVQCLVIAFGVGMTILGTYQSVESIIDSMK